MDRIGRIEAMERRFDAALAAVDALELALESYEGSLDDIRELESYLSSPERRGDLEADEEGLLPASLKRGVLSEDGLYDLLERNDGLLERLRGLFRAD